MTATGDKPGLWARWWLRAAFILAVIAVVALGIQRRSQGLSVIVMWPPSTWAFRATTDPGGMSLLAEWPMIASYQYGPIMFSRQHQVVTNVAVPRPGGAMQGK